MGIKNKVSIVIPIYRSSLTHKEEISLTQCLRILSKHSIYLVTFNSLDVSKYLEIFNNENVNISGIKYFDSKFFSSIQGYNRLMMNKFFYLAFNKYKYILIYQLDCFVFNDDLLEWCDKEYDYIGAPWFEKFNNATIDSDYLGVGNGGFSLRKIDGFLKVLNSNTKIVRLSDYSVFKKLFENKLKRIIKFLRAYLYGNNTNYIKNKFSLNEDYFWGYFAPKESAFFNVPKVTEALHFAFEVMPERMFNDNQNRIPFGCHAWWRYNLQFWIPYIESYGYELDLDEQG